MKRNDIILFSSLILLFLGIYLFTDIFSFSNDSSYEVHIRDESGKVTVKSLDEEGEYKVYSEDKKAYNVYKIKDGEVDVIDSNCRDHLCVKMNKISKDGEMIVCLPHKFYISIHSKGEKEKDGEGLDAIAE